MNASILLRKAELAKSKKEYHELKIKASRLINELLTEANPYFGDDLDLIHSDEITQAAGELARTKQGLSKCQRKIKDIERELDLL